MINELKLILENRKLYAWKVSIAEITRHNIYYTKNLDKESILQSFRFNIDIIVYKSLGNDIGESSFSIILNDNNSILDEKSINKKIDDALLLCDYSKKPSFNLPMPGKLSQCVVVDNKLKKPMKYLEQIYNKIVFELKKHKNIIVNNLELHSNHLNFRIMNSNSIDYKDLKTSLYVELTLTANNNGQLQEHVAMTEVVSLSKFNATKFVKDNVKLVNDVLNSKLIKKFKGNVILSGEAVSDFFSPHLSLNPLVMHASAKIKHMGISRYIQNKKIANFKYDKLTLTTNPLLNLNPSSSLFDYDGVVSKQVKLIENGIFKNYFSNKQYADYLNIEATGAMGSIDINGGKKNIIQIMDMLNKNKKQVLEIVSFSSFVPNSVSGDFSAEIRLGYLIKKDKNDKIIKESFKGGMFTGNVFKLIEYMYLSKDRKERNGYYGPKIVVFKDAIVSGMN